MNDLFEDKAKDWDQRPIPALISEGVSQALTQQIELKSSMTVMDFGAGTGLIGASVAPFVKKILAVDISESMLAQLMEKESLKDKVEVFCQDILAVPLPIQVDLIVSAMALHHIENTQKLFKTFADHLTDGGRIGLADLDCEDGDFHPPNIEGVFHSGFDRKELATIARMAGFSDISFSTATEVVKEGKSYSIFLMTASKFNF